jgi:hypothetical protein
MRKFAAILLIFIMAFTLFGYRFMISSLEKRVDTIVEMAIDNKEYSDAELIEIRVPLQMPYQERYTDFERHYGEITIDGKIYAYVKRKIEGDVLVVKCIANPKKQELKNTAIELAKSTNGQDTENTGKKQTVTLQKNFSPDYDDKNQFCLLADQFISGKLTAYYNSSLPEILIPIPHQPPQC